MRVHLLALAAALATFGCAHGARHFSHLESGAAAIDTVHDFEIGRTMVYSGLGQYERVHRMAPNNATGLLLLARGWTEAGWWFVEDDWEVSTDLGDDEAAEDHRTRARGAYTRAVFYGLELLEQKAQDFDHASKSAGDLRKWLGHFDASDSATLAWTGWAWLGRAEMSRDIPVLAQSADVGVALLERSVELDERAHYGLAHLALGAWHARTASKPSLDNARRHFDRALQINERKYLQSLVLYARTLYCLENDEKAYVQLLEEVVNAGDPLPEARLANVVAQRRARRYLTDVRMGDCGF